MGKKYLILTASYGDGHNTAKNTIYNHLIKSGDIVKCIDMTELLKKGGHNSKKLHALAIKIPMLWDAAFNMFDTKIINEMLNLIFKGFYQKSFDEIVNNFGPDYIICTFPAWPIFIKNYIFKYSKTFKIGVVVTDSIEIAMPWYFSSEVVDHYFVIDKWSKGIFLDKLENNHKNVHVSFFPIAEEYFTNKKTLSNKKIIFLLSGIKKSFAQEFLENIEKENFYEKIVICGGRNKKLFDFLKEKFERKNIEFYEYPNIKEMLKEMDIFIAKPGGAIMCESIANDTILFAPAFIPGQEEGNIKLLENANVGFFESDPLIIIKKIKENNFLPMLKNFKKLKKKNSVEFIIKKMQ